MPAVLLTVASPKRKAAGLMTQAALDTDPTNNSSAPYGIKQRAKRLIVALALWGWLPTPAADWLIQHGGLRHE